MWPFRSLQQRIDALEDQIAGKQAQVQTIQAAFKGVHLILPDYINQVVELNGQIATLLNQLARLRAMQHTEGFRRVRE